MVLLFAHARKNLLHRNMKVRNKIRYCFVLDVDESSVRRHNYERFTIYLVMPLIQKIICLIQSLSRARHHLIKLLQVQGWLRGCNWNQLKILPVCSIHVNEQLHAGLTANNWTWMSSNLSIQSLGNAPSTISKGFVGVTMKTGLLKITVRFISWMVWGSCTWTCIVNFSVFSKHRNCRG